MRFIITNFDCRNHKTADGAENLQFHFLDTLLQTFSKIETTVIKSLIQSNELNIFNPFTEEERIFLENAFVFMSERDG